MESFREFLIFLWGVFFIVLFFEIVRYIKYRIWLKTIFNSPPSKELIETIKDLPHFKKLPEDKKKILFYKIQRFVKEKEFIGVKIAVDEKMKYIIAFYACLPTIAYVDFCYPSLKYIYIYPHTMIIKDKRDLGGVVKEEELLISGEAVGEAVVIAWDEVKKEIKSQKRNVIIHEFAHELDFEEGAVDGIPPIDEAMFSEWSKVMFSEYEKFKKRIIKNRFLGKYSLIDSYATTNKAEFFAVLSEYYFTKPEILKKHFPKIYEELKKFYKIEF